ncbi:MAG: metalloregulator ArsR/SmtB family transcription factor [Deltaproteobacteria bacterium]|nr:metalloregulator ArsR/SmtB family transcription factor [Deltaproteobacteria bacterium]MBW2447725.1 metalloregulator ArsR/SmtB family transcription factor [Deltaproteobacteria bacterium]
MSIDAVQKIFKTLSDPTRIRILALLEREELAVQDLMAILGMAQSRVSRHLGILREAGLLADRRDGTFVFYRMNPDLPDGWRSAWSLVAKARAEDPTAARDSAALSVHHDSRQARTRAFFDAVGPEWDALRKVFNDDSLRARAVARLMPAGLTVADIGTGTGILARELHALGCRVVAVDHSPRMLEAARANLDEAGASDVELREGSAEALPLTDGEVDAAFAHMVLHYLANPAEAITEMVRVLAPGGVVVLVDFERHDREWMREELGVVWLGFPLEDVRGWLAEAGLEDVRIELDADSAGRELPKTFIASGRKPLGPARP